jgi:hypothetical protein
MGNQRFFTLYKTDISNGNIFKMLPGSGNSLVFGVDNVLPYNGAYYDDKTTWPLVPIPAIGPQKGKINNQLLSQLISLWFNKNTSNTLATVDLSKDTLVTTAQTTCGSGILSGNPAKFGIPHAVVVYLNGGNGYANNVNGLFRLANDVLGGANTAINAPDIQNAVATINNAFDGCRMLTGILPYNAQDLKTIVASKAAYEMSVMKESGEWQVKAYPNPSATNFTVNVKANSTNEKITMQVVDMYGRIIETRNVNANSTIRFGDRYSPGTYFVRVIQGKEHKEIKLVKLN